ncbi:MAG: type II secretion system protein [Phycisphaeraceae bacterium]|nr:type II secretion system protein [Phycisphaeraceae bacterium]
MIKPERCGLRLCRCTAFTLVATAMLVVGLGGAGKLLDLSSFRTSLFTWERLPDWVIDVGWFGVPTVEATAAMLWFAGVWRLTCERVVIGLLASVIALIFVHLAAGRVPTCNCYGVFMNHLAFMSEGRWLLGKAVLLLVLLMLGHITMLLTPEPQRRRPPPHDRAAAHDVRAAKAFTLVETLVIITITAVLIALTIAGLSSAKDRSRLVLTLGRLQQHGAVLATYGSDWKDQFPAPVDAALPPYELFAAGESLVLPSYFALHGSWHVGLLDQYYANQNPEIFHDARSGSVEHRYAFVMSCTLLAAPDFWSAETRLAGSAQLRSPKQSDATFASSKSTILSIQPFMSRLVPPDNLVPDPRTLTAGVPTAAADGHAASRSARRFLPGLQIGEMIPSPPGITFHQVDLFVGMHTVRGVRGRDWD